MDRFRPPLPHHCRRFFLGLCLLTALCSAPTAQAQKRSSRSTPTPSPTPRELTPDSIGAQSDSLPDPVAKVDGQPISRTELLRVAQAVLASSGKRLQDLSEAERKKAYLSVLDEIINDRLISVQAVNEKVDEVTVLRTYDNLENQYPDATAFEDQIKKSGQTPEKIRENIRHQIAQQQWLEKQVADDSKVTAQETDTFYKNGPPSKFDVPETVQASHILIAVRRDAPPEDGLAAENKIKALADRLKKGEKFEDLARDNSDDPNTKSKGGALGSFLKDRVLPEIGETAFKLKVGEVSAPVRSEFGYHLIKVTAWNPSHTATYDEVRPTIELFLTKQKRSAAIARLVQGLRDKAKIENYLS